jgi:hypothetical protein
MIWRYDRTGEGPEAHKLICRAAQELREDDKVAKRGRSWLTIAEMRQDGSLAWLSSITNSMSIGRM